MGRGGELGVAVWISGHCLQSQGADRAWEDQGGGQGGVWQVKLMRIQLPSMDFAVGTSSRELNRSCSLI